MLNQDKTVCKPDQRDPTACAPIVELDYSAKAKTFDASGQITST